MKVVKVKDLGGAAFVVEAGSVLHKVLGSLVVTWPSTVTKRVCTFSQTRGR